jgi:hypothetical protein
MNLLRAFDPAMFDRLESFRVTDEALMPEEYRIGHRPLHDDWSILRSTTRKETARRVPLPFKGISGKFKKEWMLWDMSYPTVPLTPIEYRDVWTEHGTFNLPHALIDCAVEDSGWSAFAVYLDGKWVPCFKSYRRITESRIFGKRRLAYYSGGLKFDSTCSVRADGSIRSDQMGWWEAPTCSWNKVAA